MNWQEVCDNPSLKDLPFRIELNRWGKIVMSPSKSKHSVLQGKIIKYLIVLSVTGNVIPECPVKTKDNVKVADIAWISLLRYQKIKHEIAYTQAPEVCVEVMSASNTKTEMTDKKNLYFAAGAEEVWFCSEDGVMEFHAPQGPLARSALFPEFPTWVEI